MSVLSAVGTVGGLITCQRAITSIAAGDRGTRTIALTQLGAVYIALDVVGEALGALQFGPIPTFAYYACCLTPLALAYATHRGIQNDVCKQAVVFAQDAIGPLCQLATAISAVAMIYLGFVWVGAASLTLLAVGLIERSGKATASTRSWIRAVTYPLSEACGIFSTNWFSRATGVTTIVGLAIQNLSKAEKKALAKEPIDDALRLNDLQRMLPVWGRWSCVIEAMRSMFDDPVTSRRFDGIVALQKGVLDRLRKFLFRKPDTASTDRKILAAALRDTHHPDFMREANDDALFALARKAFDEVGTLDLEYVHFKTMLRPNPATSLDGFVLLLNDKIENHREEMLKALRIVLASDEKFVQTCKKKLKDFSDEELIVLLRANAAEFVDQIKNRKITEGEPSPEGYQWLQDTLRVVIERLPYQDPIYLIDHLVNLSVRGRYCGPGKFEILENTASALVLGTRTTPLVMKILGHLQTERMHFAHQNLDNLRTNRFYNKISNPTDQHEANSQMNQIGGNLGLRNASGLYDEAGATPPILIALQKFRQWIANKHFGLQHTLSLVVDATQEQIGSKKTITIEDVKIWWKKWIDKQQVTQLEKSQFKENIERFEILGCPLVTGENQINPAIILAMLASMGVVTIPARAPERQADVPHPSLAQLGTPLAR